MSTPNRAFPVVHRTGDAARRSGWPLPAPLRRGPKAINCCMSDEHFPWPSSHHRQQPEVRGAGDRAAVLPPVALCRVRSTASSSERSSV
ncbi:hypothetical protein QJS66_22230 [Kocuria rhizophila]|nr:hypothetical protein QJS66_22230 [Kocuria rhizophila]